LANPIRCKAKQGTAIYGSEDGPSFNPGRPHEVQGNLDPREMVTSWETSYRTRLTVYPFFILLAPKAEFQKVRANEVEIFS